MRFSRYFLIAICALLPLVGCSDDADGANNNNHTIDQPKITLNKTELMMKSSETFTLLATITPSSSEAVTWSSSNEAIATVFFGLVTPRGLGETTITVSTASGLSASCDITVGVGEYKLVWSDEFDGTTLNTDNWTPIINGNGNGNNEKQYYTDRPENLRVEGGMLIIEARKERHEWAEYTSARIVTKDKADFCYGKMEARLSLPVGGGTWPAFWMMGYGTWPGCGELDIMEYVGNNPNEIIHAAHTQAGNGMNGQHWSHVATAPNIAGVDFHTFGVEWEENVENNRDCIKFFIDGVLTATYWDPIDTEDSQQWPYFEDFYFLLNIAIGGNLGGNISSTLFDNDVIMKVDYVRVYQRE